MSLGLRVAAWFGVFDLFELVVVLWFGCLRFAYFVCVWDFVWLLFVCACLIVCYLYLMWLLLFIVWFAFALCLFVFKIVV